MAHARSALSGCPSTALSREHVMLLTQQSPRHSINMVGHPALGAWQRVTDPSAFPIWQGEVLFQVCLHPVMGSTPKFMLGIEPIYSGVVIGYQVDHLLTYGWWSTLLFDHTFTVVS